jgi:hypothetical protein
MIISVPPTDSYDVEPGRYRAVCIEARDFTKNTDQGPKQQLRIIWQLTDPPEQHIRYLVGKNYDPSLTKGSDLRTDLQSWLGPLNVPKFNSDTLKGKEAVVTVRHIHNDGQPKPFCWVSEIKPLSAYDNDDLDDATLVP